jgi:tetratricopeptide (TPR) repeat protein
MKLVAGQTLAEEMKSADLPRLLQAYVLVCQAVGFAHSRGIIHRDLKPSNVMVGAFGEVQVMDWGLAKDLTGREASDEPRSSETASVPGVGTDASQTADHRAPGGSTGGQTRAGTVMGTPAYMAPEQARGEPTDARADVFALGGILCAILTGQPPFRGNSPLEVIRLAGAADLTEANAWLDNCRADAELVALCRRCLSPDPADRPADGQAVADGLTAYLASLQDRLKAAEIERAAAQARAREERKRRRVTVALAAALVGLTLLGGGGWLWIQRQQAERRAEAFQRETRHRQVVQAVLDKAADLMGQARWQEAGLIVEQTAKELPDDAPGELRERLAKAGREVRFLVDLDEARLRRARLTSQNRLDYASSPKAYARAFALFGLAVQGLTPDAFAEQLGSLRPELRTSALVALHDWLFWERDQQVKEQLLRIVAKADDDVWRRRLLRATDRNAIQTLASEVQKLELPATYLDLLSMKLLGIGNFKVAEQLMRRAVDLYPSDFWAHYNLASMNEFLNQGQKRPADVVLAERIGHLRAAVAIRPRAGFLYTDLGSALATQGDLRRAVAAFRKASLLEPGDVFAFVNLSRALRELGDPEGAITAARQAIALDARSAVAHWHLGLALQRQGRLAEARDSFRRAADQGHAEAAFHLGVAYSEGQGVEKDEKEALRWLRQAAANGDGKAMFRLGFTYLRGQGVEKDEKQAAQWIRKAAGKGHRGAMTILGLMHEGGTGVEADRAEALKWYKKAAALGDEPARKKVKELEGKD